MTLDDGVRGRRLHALKRARECGDVSTTCRQGGISRTAFYRWKQRFEACGPDGLHPAGRRRRPGAAPRSQLTRSAT